MVILKYQLTEEEYFDFSYYTGWASPDRRAFRIRYILRTISIYAVIAAAYLFLVQKDTSITGMLIFAAPAIIYFLLIPILVKRGIRQKVRAILAKPENDTILEPAEVIVSDTGIISKDSGSESRYSWEAIIRKAETPLSYYLYTNSYHAIVIPKRVLKNAEEKKELERLFNQHLSLSSEFPDR
jgi:hypothetical protein